ncbi:MAG: metallophosphoesterase family protein [Litorilinea sp.]
MSTRVPVDQLLPPDIDPASIVARVGIVSDTHAPQRLPRLPATLATAFEGVDLILHAGDVGELWVLDQLSAVAPVIAVHGNDESENASAILPYTQIVTIQGLRILLWHSHFPNWDEELASRQDDAMEPKLARIAQQGARYGCKLVIFGHWHIPLVYQSNNQSHAQNHGVTVFNPGALASGNELTRQLRQTAGILFLTAANQPHLVHIDLAAPHQPYDPATEPAAGFLANGKRFSTTILSDELTGPIFALRQALTRAEVLQIRDSILPLAHRCWQGEQTTISLPQLTQAIAQDPALPADLKQRALAVLGE